MNTKVHVSVLRAPPSLLAIAFFCKISVKSNGGIEPEIAHETRSNHEIFCPMQRIRLPSKSCPSRLTYSFLQ